MNAKRILSAFICVYLLISAVATPTLAVNFVTNHTNSINASRYDLLVRSPCPADLETLVDRLLQDLPSYANRVIVRSRFSPKTSTPPGYALPHIILAGRPEFEPLPLNSGDALPKNASQVFITTLERQYRGGKSVEIQQYHWLFFTKKENGWELAKIVSRFGTAADIRPLLGQDSQSEIAEAIRLWLRDCHAKGAGF
ncbi:hypothetical protein QUB56_14365 [Microcoleus sp. AR_TQ3_B6]|uniref:hypothetical protein n=1 Tax=Microcoleus sp. AR_TQ3_B6 TaxID=3055284 RepID=UPI002FD1E6AF